MSTLPIQPGAIASLCEKELEILRLLASGHTVKSIAAVIGRTETAVNERLREARRKTGVGSSRELARRLAAQKIWDKNPDLSQARHGVAVSGQSSNAGSAPKKGTLLMITAIPLAAAVLALASVASPDLIDERPVAVSVSMEPSPLEGRWQIDTSRIPESERPNAVEIAFHLSDDDIWTTTVRLEAADGTISEARSVAAADGRPVAITGTMAFIDTVSLRQPAPNTLVMTLSRGGEPVSTRVYTAARDGATMTETIIWPGEEVPGLETTYFTRAA